MVSLAVRLTPRANRTCLFAFLDVNNAISVYLWHFIVLFTCMNKLEYNNEHIFQKREVYKSRRCKNYLKLEMQLILRARLTSRQSEVVFTDNKSTATHSHTHTMYLQSYGSWLSPLQVLHSHLLQGGPLPPPNAARLAHQTSSHCSSYPATLSPSQPDKQEGHLCSQLEYHPRF